MTTGKILVYDDEESLCEECLTALSESTEVSEKFSIDRIGHDEFIEEMKELKARQLDLRGDGKPDYGSLKIDEASILIVDFDLVRLSESGNDPFLTGETVAYYARCFSKCQFIIGLNQFGHNNFDLTLKGHPESYIDLHIGIDQLGNPGLWGGKTEAFRPWHWPNLPKYLESLPKMTEDVMKNLDEPICRFLGFSEEIIGIMPRTVSEFIGGDPRETTFRGFLGRSRAGLMPKDKEAVKEMDPEDSARIITARISKWLERLVLPGQNILVDAPHLVYRYPSLLEGDPADLSAWNKTASFDAPENLGLNHQIIDKFRFKKDHWLSRPAWFWSTVSNYKEIKEVSNPWTKKVIGNVFCEDASSFWEKNDCKEFLSELDTPYVKRFVRICEGVYYEPRVRFSL